MFTTTRLRILRRRHNITLKELQQHCGLSLQYINRLELGLSGQTLYNEQTLERAFNALIATRRAALQELECEYAVYKGNLLRPLEVETDEL